MPEGREVLVTDPVCLDAVRFYVRELQRSGLGVEVRERASSDAEDPGPPGAHPQGRALCVEWRHKQDGEPGAAGPDDDDEADGGEEALLDRVAEHYGRTIAVLGRDREVAAAMLTRVGRKRRRSKGPRRP